MFGLQQISDGNGILGATTATLTFDYLLLSEDGWLPWVRISDDTTIYNNPWTPGNDGSIEDATNPATWAVPGGTGGRSSMFGVVNAATRAFMTTDNTPSGSQSEGLGDSFSATFAVTGDGNTLAPTFHWYRDGIEVFTGGNITIANDWHTSTLMIDSIAAGDIDVDWYCDAVSDGSLASNTFVFASCCPLAIITEPVGGSAYVGDSISFAVGASGGVLPLGYQWCLNGTDIGGATNTALALDPLALGNAGDYDCVATDSVVNSVTSDPATLAVADHLQITTQPQGADLLLGDPYTLFVETEGGFLPLTYQWIKDEEPLSGATTSSYEIVSFAEADAGSYTVYIADSLTDAMTSSPAVLAIEYPPVPVAGLAALAGACLLAGAVALRKRPL